MHSVVTTCTHLYTPEHTASECSVPNPTLLFIDVDDDFELDELGNVDYANDDDDDDSDDDAWIHLKSRLFPMSCLYDLCIQVKQT